MVDVQEAPSQPIEQGINKRSAETDLVDNSDPKRPAIADEETIEIKVQFGKITRVVQRRLESTVAELKAEIEEQTGVPASNQKLLFKGQLKDANTLRETALKNGSKLMVIGTKPEDTKVAIHNKPNKEKVDWDAVPKKEPWSTQPKHKKASKTLNLILLVFNCLYGTFYHSHVVFAVLVVMDLLVLRPMLMAEPKIQ